jgi:hypothetical protein
MSSDDQGCRSIVSVIKVRGVYTPEAYFSTKNNHHHPGQTGPINLNDVVLPDNGATLN